MRTDPGITSSVIWRLLPNAHWIAKSSLSWAAFWKAVTSLLSIGIRTRPMNARDTAPVPSAIPGMLSVMNWVLKARIAVPRASTMIEVWIDSFTLSFPSCGYVPFFRFTSSPLSAPMMLDGGIPMWDASLLSGILGTSHPGSTLGTRAASSPSWCFFLLYSYNT